MSNSAWRDLNSKGHVDKMHDQYPKSKCICQKQLVLSPKTFQLEGKDS